MILKWKKTQYLGFISAIFAVLFTCLMITSINFLRDLECKDEKENQKSSLSTIKKKQIPNQFLQIPLYFEKNEGQLSLSEQIKYFTRAKDCSYYFTHHEVLMVLQKRLQESDAGACSLLKLQFIGSREDRSVKGIEEQDYRTNYFLTSDQKNWRTSIPNYSKVLYENIYPGIDAIFYGKQKKLEYDFYVGPGKNPQEIRLHIEGSKGLTINEKGDLVIQIESDDEMHMLKPIVYQTIENQRVFIDGNFLLLAKNEIGFNIGEYNINYPLVIDPTLSYSTYLGNEANVNALAVDSAGNTYLTGQTTSSTFPTTADAFQGTIAGAGNVFITKLNADGSSLDYSTYLGGSSLDEGFGIDIDSDGNAYVTGVTGSLDFPTTSGVVQPVLAGGTDGFVTKLDPTGSFLVYSTYLGGSSNDQGNDIVVDDLGFAYVTGSTFSNDFRTTTFAFQPTNNGGSDAFVVKVNQNGSDLDYSTYLGGSGDDEGLGITIDSAGNAYVTGDTASSDFPTTTAFQTMIAGTTNAFLTKFNLIGTAVQYSTYLGGTGSDFGTDIQIDSSDNAYIVGVASSADFPTTPGAFQTTFTGPNDLYVSKFNSDGTDLLYSTFIGPSFTLTDHPDIALDSLNNAYLIGSTSSITFPTTTDAFQSSFNGGASDAILTVLNSSGSALLYSTYFGGNGAETGTSIGLDSLRNIYIAGSTDSLNFPTTAGAFQTQYATTGTDGFVVKFAVTLVAPVVTGIVPNFGPEAGGTVVTITGTRFTNVSSVLFGGVPAVFIVDSPTQITAISPPGVGIVNVTVTTLAGTSAITPADQFTYIPSPTNVFPPSRLKGIQRKNQFATQTDIVNILTWRAPNQGSPPVEYLIYRNPELTRLVGTISANERLRFKDHNRRKGKTYTYWVVSVDAFGNVSEPAIVRVH